MTVNKTRRKIVNNPLISGKRTINKQIFPNLRNMEICQVWWKESSVESNFHLAGCPRTSQESLEERQGQLPREEMVQSDSPLPAPYILPTAVKVYGRVGRKRGLKMDPYLSQRNLIPVGLGRISVCDLLLSWNAFWAQKWENSTTYKKSKTRPSSV